MVTTGTLVSYVRSAESHLISTVQLNSAFLEAGEQLGNVERHTPAPCGTIPPLPRTVAYADHRTLYSAAHGTIALPRSIRQGDMRQMTRGRSMTPLREHDDASCSSAARFCTDSSVLC